MQGRQRMEDAREAVSSQPQVGYGGVHISLHSVTVSGAGVLGQPAAVAYFISYLFSMHRLRGAQPERGRGSSYS